MDRQISIGYLLRSNPNINTILADGLTEARKMLFKSNNIEDSEVIAIKKDAVFIANRQLKNTIFSNIEFVYKHSYSIYMKLSDLEIYYKSDIVNNLELFDVKGISDKKLQLHEKGMCYILADILCIIESGDLNGAISAFNTYYSDYLHRKLPIECYRTFDNNSAYLIRCSGMAYLVNTVDKSKITDIDISYNMNILRQLYGYISSMYFHRR